jgi:hypothetical protein
MVFVLAQLVVMAFAANYYSGIPAAAVIGWSLVLSRSSAAVILFVFPVMVSSLLNPSGKRSGSNRLSLALPQLSVLSCGPDARVDQLLHATGTLCGDDRQVPEYFVGA